MTRLVEHVAQAIRIHDGDHTKGAAELAEIALTAASEFLRTEAESAKTNTMITMLLVGADLVDPKLP